MLAKFYRFKTGDLVRVRPENFAARWRKPHLRTPGYIFGVVGTIERECMVSSDTAQCGCCPISQAAWLAALMHGRCCFSVRQTRLIVLLSFAFFSDTLHLCASCCSCDRPLR